MASTPQKGYDLGNDPQSVKKLWDVIHGLQTRLATAEGTIATQGTTLDNHASVLSSVQTQANQATVTLNNQPWKTTTIPTTPGGGTPGVPPGSGTIPPPSPTPVPGPPDRGTFSATDMIGAATIENSPLDILSWPITTTLTELAWTGAGINPTFSKRVAGSRWPDYTPPGFSGPIFFTFWLYLNVGGTWYGSGILQCWQDSNWPGGAFNGSPYDPSTGQNEIPINWVYDTRWGPMYNFTPAVGSLVGYMVSAGDARGQTGVTSVRERSQIVTIPWPASNNGFDYT